MFKNRIDNQSINQSIKKCIPHIDNQVQHIQEELCGKRES